MKKLLSVQSHVVHGYVGNKAATFPLQLRGWDVDALNTVQFSNHPAYGAFLGTRYPSDELLAIYRHMAAVAHIAHTVLLSGYVTDLPTLDTLVSIAELARQQNPGLQWFLDPVLGDNGRIYVSEEMLPKYRQLLAEKHVFLVSPNHFEMELLTGVRITGLRSLGDALAKFHELYPKVQNVVVTSVELSPLESLLVSSDSLVCAASAHDAYVSSARSSYRFIFFEIPKINATFFGSGDLFLALLADAHTKYQQQAPSNKYLVLEEALSEVLTVLNRVLLGSYQWQVQKNKENGVEESTEKVKVNDLRIVQSKQALLSDDKGFEAAYYTPFAGTLKGLLLRRY